MAVYCRDMWMEAPRSLPDKSRRVKIRSRCYPFDSIMYSKYSRDLTLKAVYPSCIVMARLLFPDPGELLSHHSLAITRMPHEQSASTKALYPGAAFAIQASALLL